MNLVQEQIAGSSQHLPFRAASVLRKPSIQRCAHRGPSLFGPLVPVRAVAYLGAASDLPHSITFSRSFVRETPREPAVRSLPCRRFTSSRSVFSQRCT
jgi:hypothetical protein